MTNTFKHLMVEMPNSVMDSIDKDYGMNLRVLAKEFFQVAKQPEINPDEFHDLFSRMRDMLGLDDKALAPKIGVAVATIVRWANGDSAPFPPAAPAVAAHLGNVTLNRLDELTQPSHRL